MTAEAGGEEAISAVEHAVLERRARRLQIAPDERRDEDLVWIAEVAIGDVRYALRLDAVRAVLPLRRVTPVPLAPAHVIGVTRWEGRIITVLSLASIVGVRGWRVDPEILLVLEPRPGRRVAVDCEQVPKATAIEASLVAGAAGREAVVPILSPELGRLQFVADLDALLERAPS